jgi:hypothetical protein
MNKKELKWECEECGRSAVDLEEHYGRFVGSVKIIDAEDDGE